jgi:hypothetical protein
MIVLHVLSWGISGVCILVVGLYGHAGKNEETSNTGGWCWIKASSQQSLFLFELIGGKFIEWISCFLILPVLYAVSAYHLVLLNRTVGNSLPVHKRIISNTIPMTRVSNMYSTNSLTTDELRTQEEVFPVESKGSSSYRSSLFTTFGNESIIDNEDARSAEALNGMFAPISQAQKSQIGYDVTNPIASYSPPPPSVPHSAPNSPNSSHENNRLNSTMQLFVTPKASNLADYYKKLVSVI